ncbi:MAG: M23 family metallopeptidase, partial [Thermomicrobiales bacterium]|nr:M23 family metallopeptidase [Thermomicrobiales bacterium]
MTGSLVDRLACMFGVLHTRRAAAALLAGLTISPAIALSDAVARPKKKRKKRRKPGGGNNTCEQRCGKKKSKQARRRCRRRCQANQRCATDRDCAPCARCQDSRCVNACQAGEVCEQGRCVPGACPVDGAEMVAATYADVADDYAAGTARAIPAGPDAIANFVNGEFEALYGQFSPEVQALTSPEDLADFADILQHNRVHFEVPSSIGIFDGYFDASDNTISGYFTQIFTQNFWIELTTPLDPDNPLLGTWEGVIWDPTGAIYPDDFPIVVTFWMEGGELTGRLDVVDLLENIPITSISSAPQRLLSSTPGLVRFRPEPNWTQYSGLVGWGDADLAITVWVDADHQLIGLNIVPDWPPLPDPAAGLPIETVLRFPLNGVWWVATGGEKHFENHHLDDPAQRHACDFIIWNTDGSGRGSFEENEDYWSWNQPIFAPAAGLVVDAAHDVPDNAPGSADPTSAGNYVILETAPQEFVILAHMRQGSVAVTIGEQVEEGQFLGRIGNSGFSFEPHLHMHFLRGTD